MADEWIKALGLHDILEPSSETEHGQYWWASICSGHQYYAPSCRSCQTGSWVLYTKETVRYE